MKNSKQKENSSDVKSILNSRKNTIKEMLMFLSKKKISLLQKMQSSQDNKNFKIAIETIDKEIVKFREELKKELLYE